MDWKMMKKKQMNGKAKHTREPRNTIKSKRIRKEITTCVKTCTKFRPLNFLCTRFVIVMRIFIAVFFLLLRFLRLLQHFFYFHRVCSCAVWVIGTEKKKKIWLQFSSIVYFVCVRTHLRFIRRFFFLLQKYEHNCLHMKQMECQQKNKMDHECAGDANLGRCAQTLVAIENVQIKIYTQNFLRHGNLHEICEFFLFVRFLFRCCNFSVVISIDPIPGNRN